MAIKIVYCVSCGVRTTFNNDTPDNDMITQTDTNVYKCNSCGAETSDGPDRFRTS